MSVPAHAETVKMQQLFSPPLHSGGSWLKLYIMEGADTGGLGSPPFFGSIITTVAQSRFVSVAHDRYLGLALHFTPDTVLVSK